jgi:hypothetical protein
MSSAVLILGAGWSAAAGLPLAAELIAGPLITASVGARDRCNSVLAAYRQWLSANPNGTAEPFLAEVLAGRVHVPVDPSRPTLYDSAGGPPLPWQWAVEAVAIRLANPVVVSVDDSRRWSAHLPEFHPNKLRYGTNLSLAPPAPPLRTFLTRVLRKHRLAGVLTTNYDTIAERLLRHRPMADEREPGFFYGGLPRPQYAHGHLPWDRFDSSFSGPTGELLIEGTVPVCKLHGSLNWARTADRISVYRDYRSAFRQGGTAAIVAPTPEKSVPPWLLPVWSAAADLLTATNRWIVVGYSLPPYDLAACDLFERAAERAKPVIEVHDPFAKTIGERWRRVCGASVEAFSGIGPAT